MTHMSSSGSTVHERRGTQTPEARLKPEATTPLPNSKLFGPKRLIYQLFARDNAFDSGHESMAGNEADPTLK